MWRGCGDSRTKNVINGAFGLFVCIFLDEIYIVTSLSIVYIGLCNLKFYFKETKAPLQPVYNKDKWTYDGVKKRDSEMYKQSVIINNISIHNNTEIVETGLYYGWSLLQITTKDLQVWRNLSKVPDINAWNLSLSIYAFKCNLEGSMDGIKCFMLHLVIILESFWVLLLPKMISIFDHLQNTSLLKLKKIKNSCLSCSQGNT